MAVVAAQSSKGGWGSQTTQGRIPALGRLFVSRDQGATNQSNGTDTQMHTKAKHLAFVSALGCQVGFGNFYNFGGAATDNTDAVTIRAALTDSGGNAYPIWFNGSRDVTISPGGVAWGDCGIPLIAGSSYFSRTKVSVASAGMKWPIALGDVMNNSDEGATGTTSSTDLTLSGTIGPNANAGYYPFAVLGHSNVPQASVAAFGDSIMAGKGDNLLAGQGAGWVTRVFSSTTPLHRVTPMSGGTIGQYTATSNTGHFLLLTLPGSYTVALSTLGINDITGGQTYAAMQTRLQSLWGYLRSLGVQKVWQSTITPVSTSTDAWVTTGNQTVTATNGIRTQVNDWIRTYPSGMDGYLEVADLVESARNSGIWIANYTADGTHPTSTAHAAIAAGLSVSGLL